MMDQRQECFTSPGRGRGREFTEEEALSWILKNKNCPSGGPGEKGYSRTSVSHYHPEGQQHRGWEEDRSGALEHVCVCGTWQERGLKMGSGLGISPHRSWKPWVGFTSGGHQQTFETD